MRPSTAHCSYGFDVDFPLSSSVILVIAVALWIVWVAPYMLRNGRHQLQPAGEFVADVIDLETTPLAGNVMKMTAQQENPMTRTQHTVSGPGTAGFDGGLKPAAPGPAFRIRYGRLALALAGLLALLTGLVSAVLRIFGVGSAVASRRSVARRCGLRPHAPLARAPGPPPQDERRFSVGHECTGTPVPLRPGADAAPGAGRGAP